MRGKLLDDGAGAGDVVEGEAPFGAGAEEGDVASAR